MYGGQASFASRLVAGSLLLMAAAGAGFYILEPAEDLTLDQRLLNACYAAPAAPRIELSGGKLRVMQDPVLEVPFQLKFDRKWLLVPQGRLDFSFQKRGPVRFTTGPGEATPVLLVMPFRDLGQPAGELPGFELTDEAQSILLKYSREGPRCEAARR